jgi:drug/metabolite transporter (DMT)-like permease
MDAVLLAASSASLFGAMTVAIRLALRRGTPPELGTAATVATALAVAVVYAAVRGEWELGEAWPFLLAGLLAPGCSQILFTFAVRDAGASRASVAVGVAPLVAVAIALVFLDEPLVAGLAAGALLIVGGGVLLALEPGRPEHLRRVGIVFALLATVAFGTRDSLVRWLGTSATDVGPGIAVVATMLSATLMVGAVAGVAAARRAPVRLADVVRFVPAGLCYGVSYVCLFEAFYRGRVSVVSPLVATESLWGVTLSALLLRRSELVGRRLALGAVLVVAGGILIGASR